MHSERFYSPIESNLRICKHIEKMATLLALQYLPKSTSTWWIPPWESKLIRIDNFLACTSEHINIRLWSCWFFSIYSSLPSPAQRNRASFSVETYIQFATARAIVISSGLSVFYLVQSLSVSVSLLFICYNPEAVLKLCFGRKMMI